MNVRMTKPEANNKYYITKSNGGWSNAIVGKPTDKDCNVLANCVGYAYGRFNEIGQHNYCKYLAPVNAENFIQYKGSCTVGQVPKEGAVMVWQKGASLSGSDGAGHVAIVEKVNSPTEVFTSESGYNSSAFWNATRSKGNGNWGANSDYTFLGFIYNPSVPEKTNEELAKEVIEGKWGNGQERKDRLTNAGYNYSEVQKIVNELVKPIEKPIKVGDRVVPIRLISYDGKALKQYDKDYIVTEIIRDRAVLKTVRNGKTITWAALNINNIRRIK